MVDTAPKNQLCVECLIEAQSEYQLGKPITVTGTLKNSGPSAIWILRWNTFLEEMWLNCLSVTHNGLAVPYIGVLASRGIPDESSFIRIPAGESRSRQIDISENYGITEPGDYEVSFRLPMLAALETNAGKWPQDESQHKAVFIESAKVTFRMAGAALAPRMEKRVVSLYSSAANADSFPAEPKPARFNAAMSEEEIAKYRKAHSWAYKSILAALRNVESAVPTDAYQRWFAGNQSELDHVKLIFGEMASWMATDSVRYEKTADGKEGCDGKKLATTSPGSKGAIHLCPKAFDEGYLRDLNFNSADYERAFILVHEISHAAGNTNNGNEEYYSWFYCRWWLPKVHPDLAVKNAQNYAYFAMSVNPNPPPGSENHGIWERRQIEGTPDAEDNPAAAALVGDAPSEQVVMMAYRDPTVVYGVHGQLYYKILVGARIWHEAAAIKSGGQIRHSLLAPALAVHEYVFYCVYVDPSKRLICLFVDARPALNGQIHWEDLVWTVQGMIDNPVSDKYGPALATFGAAIYCVYVDASGALKCAGNLAGHLLVVTIPINLDYVPKPGSTPALVVFGGELKCAYYDRQTQKIEMLAFEPDPPPGSRGEMAEGP